MEFLNLFLTHDTLNELIYLFERWQDEKEYEDWKEYEDQMKYCLNNELPSAKFIKGTQEPFGLLYNYKGTLLKTTLEFTSNKVSLKTISL